MFYASSKIEQVLSLDSSSMSNVSVEVSYLVLVFCSVFSLRSHHDGMRFFLVCYVSVALVEIAMV